jgi:hypothetical protein
MTHSSIGLIWGDAGGKDLLEGANGLLIAEPRAGQALQIVPEDAL